MPSPVTVETDLRDILNTINERFDKLDARFDKINERFEKTDEKLDKLTQEINQTNIKLATVETKLTGLESQVRELGGTQKNQLWSLIVIVAGALFGITAKLFLSNP
jgi:uncharacterized coiled-coil DUF342 family protein